ncbi:hypothetical protein CLV51_10291 [Chitinophaga niastensis]|uniref:Uncharacterized protein n=1 Tax=Chitinophaga niastensis TaxID=536980 RepID=A0A2P8HM03_CHINA|nr:hypothetical protein [Chitinophaga niastensis]PSL47246.1 hypothetical protein CLV51_10291 [Chitinophaga niastensis]
MLIRKRGFGRVLLIILGCTKIAAAQQSIRITQSWEFLKGDLGGIWEGVRPAAEGGIVKINGINNVQ